MESGETYSQTALDDNTGGTIFAHDDLAINGSGSLEIVANYKHGIDANDDLVIAGGTITVTAPSDGMHVNDSFRMCTASLTIAAGDDAIHSDTDIYIESGALLVTECYEGLEALRIEVAGGDITIYPTDDAFNANGGSGGFGGGPGNMGGGSGGPMHSSDDSEHPAPPDGSEDGERHERPENFDGARPDFSRSEAPSNPDMSEMSTPPDMSGMPDDAPAASSDDSSEDEDAYVIISGGNILIVNENAQDADGIDSNGSVYITGGSVLVSLSGNGSNNAIDYGSENGGVAEISGGSVIACGGSAMAESFDESSTQPSIAYTGSVAAASMVALRDAKGGVLLEWEVPCSFTYLLISCPEMTLGETYTLQMGDMAEDVTLESVVTTLGSNSGFGGMGGGRSGMGGGKHGAPPGGSGSGNG